MSTGKHVDVFNGVLGINAKYDPSVLRNSESGAIELAEAYNCVVTDRGEICSRGGFDELLAHGGHSLFSCPIGSFFANGEVLYQLSGTSVNSVFVGLVGQRVYYTFDGFSLYFTDGAVTGVIDSGGYRPWSSTVYAGDRLNYRLVYQNIEALTFTEAETAPQENVVSVVLTAPPAGNGLAHLWNRVFISNENFVYYTEPWWKDWYAVGENWIPFPTTVKMIAAVNDGLWVADENRLYFLSGESVQNLSMLDVAAVNVVHGTVVNCDGAVVGGGDMKGTVVVGTATDGIFLCGNGGMFQWLTRDKHDRIEANSGWATIWDDKYICMIDA